MLVPRTAILTCSIYVLLNCLTHEFCQATAIPDITTSSPHTTTKGYKTPQAEILEDEDDNSFASVGIKSKIQVKPNSFFDDVCRIERAKNKTRDLEMKDAKQMIRLSLQKSMDQCLDLKDKPNQISIKLNRVKRQKLIQEPLLSNRKRMAYTRYQNKLNSCQMISTIIFVLPKAILSNMIC